MKMKKREKKSGEGGCVQRMEVIVKRKKSQGRCDRRSEAFVKIQKKKKKNFFCGVGGQVVGGGSGWM